MARAVVLQAEARSLPLPDASVDLLATSPPYYLLRDYKDGDESLAGQIGSERTAREYIANLVECTAEWMRVLKPEGSMFVNLADKFAQPGKGIRNQQGIGSTISYKVGAATANRSARDVDYEGFQFKSLMGLPWRYALACMDELGLILRRDIIWHKSNGLPESANDRCRSSHEYLFHFVKQPRYYSAVDEIREPLAEKSFTHRGGGQSWGNEANPDNNWGDAKVRRPDPRGALPGSVWTFPSEPLSLPDYLGVEHYAAFPTALPRKVILGWSPPAICLECGQGRFPVTDQASREPNDRLAIRTRSRTSAVNGTHVGSTLGYPAETADRRITGYACACTPYTDHPERRRPTVTPGQMLGRGRQSNDARAAQAGSRHHGNDWPERLPVREYHLAGWTPPPSRPAVVLDPFGGTGTTALTAVAHGRHGISCDLSAGYSKAARWRTGDSGERARARGQAKPPPAKRVREDVYGITDELDALLEESL